MTMRRASNDTTSVIVIERTSDNDEAIGDFSDSDQRERGSEDNTTNSNISKRE